LKLALLKSLAAGAVMLAPSADANGPASSGLCTAQETAWLSCITSRQRWIGLCGNSPRALQYRFGRPGALELQVPDDPADGVRRMLFAHYARYQTDRVEVRFENQGTDYVLFDHSEAGVRRAGVRVVTADAKERELVCVGPIASRLGELRKTLKCDADNALNGGKCP
jgi:hypothetical protein